jgi:hypothetical protein
MGYDSDPHLNPGARRYQSISYSQVLVQDLRVMDSTAIALCKENNIPILVFNLSVRGNIRRAVMGETIGTLVGGFVKLPEAESTMQKTVEATQRAFNTIRTGRANATLLDRVMVDYYNTPHPSSPWLTSAPLMPVRSSFNRMTAVA